MFIFIIRELDNYLAYLVTRARIKYICIVYVKQMTVILTYRRFLNFQLKIIQ